MSKLAIKATSKFKKDYKTAIKRGIKTMCKVMEELRNNGLKEGIKQGKDMGMHSFAELAKQLIADGRMNELNRAIENDQYRDELFKEYSIQ